ncbi:MAG: preprotein translocase subunit SecE [Ignavibacteriae bacterium]|jgi:preprotein translocase subunit SecE|nr:MAG: preprotein translocase subunit SecE [Ignavibacteriota bacterium]
MLAQSKQFFTDVSKEMKKVSWPTRDQLRESTVVVIVTCLVITGIVFVIDQAMTQIMNLIF